jgi:hypothetical protein
MKKLLITNVVYGSVYTQLFLEQHLKSMLDQTNIPAVKERVEYMIFSDKETIPIIAAHDNFQILKDTVQVEIGEIGWPDQPIDRFNLRYNVLMGTFQEGLKKAIARGSLMSALTADMVAARNYLPMVLDRMDKGFDAVLMQPPRCVAEAMVHELGKYPRAMHADDLWNLCYANMHPLWNACHWEAAQFTKLPFSLLWNSGKGLLVRSFSITPIIFTPYEEMLTAQGVIDRSIPAMFKNPYWAHDWTEAPIMGVEPYMCYFPAWANHTASVDWVRGWAKQSLDQKQFEFVKEKLYFPNKEVAQIKELMEKESDDILSNITKE